MDIILVWVLVLHSWDGGMLKIDNIADYDSCDRMLRRAIASAADRRDGTGRTINGTCTQMKLLVPKAASINVLPASAPAPTIKNFVVIKEKK